MKVVEQKMIQPITETLIGSIATLEAHDLCVRPNNEHSLWIANHTADEDDGILLSNDACVLARRADQWVAVFPANGMRTYEVSGSLPEAVSLILAVYARHRQDEGTLTEAFRQTVPDPDIYLNGR
jgi:hypothetical protein